MSSSFIIQFWWRIYFPVSHLLLIVDMYKDEERWLVGKDHQAGQCKDDAIKQNDTKICNKAGQCKYDCSIMTNEPAYTSRISHNVC